MQETEERDRGLIEAKAKQIFEGMLKR
jgi:hypothetical protein